MSIKRKAGSESVSTLLLAGTVILTGIPQGVGLAHKLSLWLAPGDEVAIEIEGIGRLIYPVEPEAALASA